LTAAQALESMLSGMFICLQCHRHVREVPCPFCGETRAPASHLPGPAAMRVGMTRAALIVGALSGGAAGCGDTAVPDDVVVADTSVYGIPRDDGPAPDALDAGDVPVVSDTAVYGIPRDVVTAGDVYGVPADR